MLATAHRLRRKDEFTAAMRGGRRAGRGSIVVHLAPQSRPAVVRAGFVVSKAVGPAVVRNLVRRRLRHLVAERLPMLPPGDVVVRALPGAAGASYAELGRDLDEAVAAVLRRTGGVAS